MYLCCKLKVGIVILYFIHIKVHLKIFYETLHGYLNIFLKEMYFGKVSAFWEWGQIFRKSIKIFLKNKNLA